MNLSIRIQHVPERERWTNILKILLSADKRVKVITDEKHELWEGAKSAITSYDKGATHVLVLQDDTLPCKHFIPAVEKIVELLPNEPITFFSNSEMQLKARSLDTRWVKLRTFLMAQAYLLPVAIADDFVSWGDRHIKPAIYFDDDRMAMYFFHHQKYVWATSPSLVEHLGWNQSTLSGYQPNYVYEPRLRMAKFYAGFEKSALDYDWSKGLDNPVIDDTGNWGSWCHNFIP